MSSARLFGTDGIRGKVNTFPMVPELVCAVGRSVAQVLGRKPGSVVLVATDTRESADMLSFAAAAGIASAGATAEMLGVLPTPGAARLAAETGAAAAIVVSASHNPFTDNGIKVFDGSGFKLGDDLEARIESGTLDGFGQKGPVPAGRGPAVGRVRRMTDAEARYLEFLKGHGTSLDGMKIVLDCANGAAYRVGPQLLRSLGAEVRVIGVDPDGRNINDGCGSEHPAGVADAVLRWGADIGLALDGDADRLVAVDETGEVVSGDQIVAVCAASMIQRGELPNRRVVTTVMSNIGLSRALKQMGVEHRRSAVGDRRVLEEMNLAGAALGGEDSGHLVFLDAHTTGDGLYAALRLLGILRDSGQPLSRQKTVMKVYPQVLINVPVGEKPEIGSIPAVAETIREVEGGLGDGGRVLVRYSGTQPLCRVMVEGPTEAETRRACEKIARAVADAIGR
jgi:phosphoglucosamine mutase